MQLFAGTSGFSYKAWKGPFYPEKLPDGDMLAYYAKALPAVEVNNTFYRMPRAEVMERWAAAVPPGFQFAIKASQRITHRARLRDAHDSVAYLWKAISPLGEHLGPLLFQLPPNFRADPERLRSFLGGLPEGCRAALEFRHPSWTTDEVRAVLRENGAAWCTSDVDDEPEPPLEPTAEWGYLRLRRSGYDEGALDRWTERIAGAGWERAFVFFKHEDEGAAPRLARALLERFGGGGDVREK